jgi:hypothetical protein
MRGTNEKITEDQELRHHEQPSRPTSLVHLLVLAPFAPFGEKDWG